MKNFIHTLLFVICLLLPIAAAHGQNAAENPEDIARRLQSRYDKIGSITFNFTQNTSGDMAGRARKGTGKAAFVKLRDNSYMRWDYSSPDHQVLVSDGKTFSMYFANLQQMIVSPADTLDADLTYSFFTGKGILTRDFQIRPADEDVAAGEQGRIPGDQTYPQKTAIPGPGYPPVGDP